MSRLDPPRAHEVGLAAERGTNPAAERGVSLSEVLLVMFLLVTTTAIVTPTVTRLADAERLAAGASGLAAWLRESRHQAIFTGRTTGVVFQNVAGRWTVRRCTDANGNGLRTTEIASGVDQCTGDGRPVEEVWPGTTVGVDPGIPGPDGTPPSATAVRFGASGIASFSADGTGTSGTVFLRSAMNVQFAVRVAGATGRMRVLRFDPGSGGWRE